MRCTKLLICGFMVAALGSSGAAPKLPVLLIDGQNNHNWRATTPVVKDILEKSGRFTVEVMTAPGANASVEEKAAFRPEFSKYKAVFSNYNGSEWSAEVKADLEKYMAEGGGLVLLHAAENSFPGWVEFQKMCALSWQGPEFGERISVDDAGKVVRTPKGEGPGAGHGPQHPYEMTVRDKTHPIMRGLPEKWTHVADELYHGQRGLALNMTILGTAFSAKDKAGTGTNEPLLYTVKYGKGRVFVNLLGHDVPQVSAPDCAALIVRGTEWAATGKVTVPVPKDFPGVEK